MKYQSAKKRGMSNGRIFLASFCISLAVLLLIAGGIMLALFHKIGPEQNSAAAEPETEQAALPYQPDAKTALNLLVISVQERSDSPHAFTLCRFDPTANRLLLVPIPPETITTVKAKKATFAQHYAYAGSQNVQLAAESLLLCDVQRYIRISRTGACALIDTLGGLTHTFAEEYQTPRVTVPAGTHLLNGELLYEIANSPPKNEPPDNWRLTLAGELLTQRLNADADAHLDSLMSSLWNQTDTDLSRFDYTSRRKALTYFLESEEKRVEIIPLSGSWNRSHTEFVPNEAILSELRSIFSMKQ